MALQIVKLPSAPAAVGGANNPDRILNVVQGLRGLVAEIAETAPASTDLLQDLADRSRRESRDTLTCERAMLLAARDVVGMVRLHLRIARVANSSRKEALGRQSSRAVSALPATHMLDTIRIDVASCVTRLNRIVLDKARRLTSGEAGIHPRLSADIERLNAAELIREANRKGIQLSLAPEVQAQLSTALYEVLAAYVRTVFEQIARSFQQLDVALRTRLAADTDCALPAAGSGDVQMLSRLLDLTRVQVKYRGMLPRRGFLQRLAEGRRSIFTVLMIFSLFGSFLGFNWRSIPLLGALFLCGFIAAVIQTYRSWKDEDHEQVDQELAKARELLRAEVKRILAEATRELHDAVSEEIEARRREILGRAESALRAAATNNQRVMQIARESTQAALKQVDIRATQLNELSNRLTRLDTDLGMLLTQNALPCE